MVERATSPGWTVEHHQITTTDGWTLEVHRGRRAGTLPGTPVLFVPGFGMNSYIFRFHPRGRSFMEVLLDAGLDPWSVDLRGQTSSAPRAGASRSVGLADYAFTDVPAAIDFVARKTGYERIHAVGCSLGGALLYAYGGTVPEHRIDRLVAMATPLRWTKGSLVTKAFATLMPLMGWMTPRGTRQMARLALPVASRLVPGALSIYLNPAITDTSRAGRLAKTVEDPHPRVNRQLGRWIQRVDLQIGGRDIREALGTFDRPLLVVAGNADRICPVENAMAALDATVGPGESLVVGHGDERVSHADLFVSDLAPERVFAPVARWLLDPR